MHNRKIRAIIEELNKLNPPDVVVVSDAESAILKADVREKLVKEFYQAKVIPAYQKKFLDAKGADGVLLDVERILKAKINRIEASLPLSIERVNKAEPQLEKLKIESEKWAKEIQDNLDKKIEDIDLEIATLESSKNKLSTLEEKRLIGLLQIRALRTQNLNAIEQLKELKIPEAALNKIKDKFDAFETIRKLKTKHNAEIATITRYTKALHTLLNPPGSTFYPDPVPGGGVAWQNWLHKGTQFAMDNILFRDLLAYYWLAASDENMQVSDEVNKEFNGNKEEIVAASKENFFAVLEENRRAHNEGVILNHVKDNPSCGPGTFGRILLRTSIYNKLTAIPRSPYPAIPGVIENFILKKLESYGDPIKNAFYRYINNTVMMDEIHAEDVEYVKVFNECLTVNHQQELLDYVWGNLPFKVVDAKVKAQEVKAVIAIEKLELDFLVSDFNNLHHDFVKRLQSVAVLGFRNKKIEEEVSEEILSLRLKINSLSAYMEALDRALGHEAIKTLLSPSYKTSNSYKESFFSLVNEFKEQYLPQAQALIYFLKNDLSPFAEELAKKTIAKLEAKEGISVPAVAASELIKIQEKLVFPEKIKLKIAKLEKTIKRIELLLNPKVEKDELYSMLPSMPGKRFTLPDGKDAENWARHIVYLLLELDEKAQLLKDKNEILKVVGLMSSSFKEEGDKKNEETMKKTQDYFNSHDQVMEKILGYLNSHFILRTFHPKILKEVYDFMQNTFTETSLRLPNGGDTVYRESYSDPRFSYRFCVKLVFDFKKVKTHADLMDFSIQHKPIFTAWVQAAIEIIDNDTHKNFDSLFRFILGSFVHTVCLPRDLSKDQVASMRSVCEMYLDLRPILLGQHLMFYNKDAALPEKIKNLMIHLNVVFITIQSTVKNLMPDLFVAEYLRLMSANEAELSLKENTCVNPFFFRISLSAPYAIVVCHQNYNSQQGKELLWPKNTKDFYIIAGKRIPVNLQVLAQIKDLTLGQRRWEFTNAVNGHYDYEDFLVSNKSFEHPEVMSFFREQENRWSRPSDPEEVISKKDAVAHFVARSSAAAGNVSRMSFLNAANVKKVQDEKSPLSKDKNKRF